MATCPECKVEIGNAIVCPLCGYSHDAPEKIKTANKGLFKNVAKLESEEKVRRMVALETILVSSIIAVIAILATDLINNFKLTWSLYPLYSILLLIVILIPLLLWPKKLLFIFIQAMLAVPLYLFAMDAIDGRINWSVKLGIPISFSAFFMASLAIFLCLKTKRRGLNVLAFILFAIAGFCLTLESLMIFYKKQNFHLYWSSISASCIIPVALFLLYAHYRLTKNTTLKKLFHLLALQA